MDLALVLIVPWLAPLVTFGRSLSPDRSTWAARWFAWTAGAEVLVSVFAAIHSPSLSSVGRLLVVLVAVIGALSVWASGESVHGIEGPLRMRSYRLGLTSFWWSLLLLAVSGNLGLSWAAIELTTITSAWLVASSGLKTATEAAWKYVILCSTGLLLALLGVLFLLALQRTGHQPFTMAGLDFSAIRQASASMPKGPVELALIFLTVGLGTKIGFAPMHTWLPDAHSEAPAPASGLLSGVLLPLVLVTLWRVLMDTESTVGRAMPRELLIGFGLLTVVVATPFLLVQTDLKRLLAYSTLEQMGLLAIAFGTGSRLALEAAFLQLIVHALIKSGLFYVSGDLLDTLGTKQIRRAHGLLAAYPRLGWPWLLGFLTLGGLPPLPMFLTELVIVFSLFSVSAYLGVLLAVCLAVLFIGMAHYTLQMALGKPWVRTGPPHDRGSRGAILALSAAAVLGVLGPLFPHALGVLTGGHAL